MKPKQKGPYALAESERPTLTESRAAGLDTSRKWWGQTLRAGMRDGVYVMAEWTGEYRPPKAGEWFLSGAIVEAYKAQ